MANGWIFPSNNYGIITGIGEAGIETFKGSPYKSLAREICQNSMDARHDSSKPVVIEFTSFTIADIAIPDYGRLSDAINSCLKFWTEQNNKKTIDFFKKAKAVVEGNIIHVLRISDFNTTGLQGSDEEFNTAWHNLVKASGVSGKEGSAGGSFGIGKSAPFACSDLRTLFYATKDIDGLSAFQGIARLVSFREKGFLGKDKDSITTGIGYYSSDKKNSPLRECLSLDPRYTRTEYGTDIFVLGFNKSADWKSEIICSILDEFLIAVFNGELVVKIDDTTIDKNNLGEIMEFYKEQAKIAYNYYQVLTDKNAVVIEHELSGLGTVELRILVKQGLHRKVMMCRRNGMKIFDKANISSTIQFAGICTLKDDQINAYFREMENPQHNAWEPERHASDNKTKAKANMSMLYKYVKNEVIELGKKTTVDEVDAEGMGEFFADTESLKTDNENKSEAISSTTSSIEINVSKPVREMMGYEESLSGETEYPEDDDLNGSEEDQGGTGSKDKHDDGHNRTHSGTGFGGGDGDNPGTNGSGINQFRNGISDNADERKVKHIGTMHVRLYLSDREQKKYNLVFTPQKSMGSGYLQIDLSGEQSKVKASIISAVDLVSKTALNCRENKIYLNNIQKMQRNKVSFFLEYVEECSMEVTLFGYSS